MSISANEGEEEIDSGPCLPVTDNGMMVNTPYPQPTLLPTELPSEPCTQPTASVAGTSVSTQQVMTIVAPVAVAAVVLCAVIVGAGILCCYLIMTRKTQPTRYVPWALYHSVITLANTCQS